MRNFQYHNPTRVVFGQNTVSEIAVLIPAHARVLILWGGGSIKANGTWDEVHDALQGHDFFDFGGIEPNPTLETLLQAVDVVRAKKCTFLLAVGGGSVLDGTKFVAAAAQYDGDPWDILTSQGAVVRSALPFGAILTLPATGSEMNSGSVISRHGTQEKKSFRSPYTFPQFSVLDPTKTYSLPLRQVGNGIVDAFTHVMEQYLTYPVAAMVQDRFAESLLKNLIDLGPQVCSRPHDYEVRSNFMWTATMALNGLIGVGVPQDWATHMLGHELTALYGLDHAQTLAIVLPAMLTVRKEAKKEKLLQYARCVWGIVQGSEAEKIEGAIEKTRSFFEKVGVKTRLSSYGIPSSAAKEVLAKLEVQGQIAWGEKEDVDLLTISHVLELCR